VALCWVRVVRSDDGGVGDDVYVNSNYIDPAGFVGTAFKTETGRDTFETLGIDGFPNWRKDQVIDQPPDNSEANPVSVTLDPVVPGS
jgi:hypothetical protein